MDPATEGVEEEVELGLSDSVSFVRAVFDEGSMEVRESDGSMPILTGKFAHYGGWNEIYSPGEAREMGLRGDRYMERLSVGAFTKTLQERAGQIKVLFNHGLDPSIGKKPIGEIVSVREEQDGPHYEVKLLDASYVRDLIPGLKANLYGSSYRSDLVKGSLRKKPSKSDHNPEGLPEAEVAEIRMKEFGPVTFPADQNATAGVRSLYDEVARDQLAVHLRELLITEQPITRSETDAATLEEEEQPEATVEAVRATAVHLGSRRTRVRSNYLDTEEVRPTWQL